MFKQQIIEIGSFFLEFLLSPSFQFQLSISSSPKRFIRNRVIIRDIVCADDNEAK